MLCEIIGDRIRDLYLLFPVFCPYDRGRPSRIKTRHEKIRVRVQKLIVDRVGDLYCFRIVLFL